MMIYFVKGLCLSIKYCQLETKKYLPQLLFIMRLVALLLGQVPEGDVHHLRLQDEVELVRLLLDAAHHVLGQLHQTVHVALEAGCTLGFREWLDTNVI